MVVRSCTPCPSGNVAQECPRSSLGPETHRSCKRTQMKAHAITVVFGCLCAAPAAYAQSVTESVQPGRYSRYDVAGPATGLLRLDGTTIGRWDDPSVFALPEHVEANQLWFSSGWMTWEFPVNVPAQATIDSVSYTAELSSECPGACPLWPSDLAIRLNGVEIDSWTIPGDPDTGWLVTWVVNKEGTFLRYRFQDGDLPVQKVSDVTVDRLAIVPGRTLSVTLSVVQTTAGGGLTIYGKGYPGFAGTYYPGNTPTIHIEYTETQPSCTYALSQSGIVVGRAGAEFVGLFLEVFPNSPACPVSVVSRSGFVTVSTCHPGLCMESWGSTGIFLRILPNDSGEARWGVVSIAGQDVPVMQAGPPLNRLPLDMNRDGHVDLLWQHETDGRLAVWTMDGAAEIAGTLLDPSPVADTSWKIVGSGDLDGDLWPDIVWQNTADGRVAAWLMIATSVKQASLLSISEVPDLNWRIGAVGDFNEDGRADLVWHHEATRQTALWVMDGLRVLFGTLLPAGSGAEWRLAGNGDFNGDGNLDLVWQNDADGRIAAWLMNGTQDVTEVRMSPPALEDTAWKIRAVGDLDGDGKPDLIWQHLTTGALGVWFMDGVSRVDGTLLSPPAVADLGWRIVGPR